MCTIGIQIRKSSKTVLLKNVWTLTTYMSWLKSTIFTIVLSLRNSLFTYLRWTMTKLQLHCSTVIAGVGPKPNFSTGSPPIMWFLIKRLLWAGAKGQMILKGLFGILGFFQKTNKRIRFFGLTVPIQNWITLHSWFSDTFGHQIAYYSTNFNDFK